MISTTTAARGPQPPGPALMTRERRERSLVRTDDDGNDTSGRLANRPRLRRPLRLPTRSTATAHHFGHGAARAARDSAGARDLAVILRPVWPATRPRRAAPRGSPGAGVSGNGGPRSGRPRGPRKRRGREAPGG